jgi:hypothetical protein
MDEADALFPPAAGAVEPFRATKEQIAKRWDVNQRKIVQRKIVLRKMGRAIN